MFISLKCIACIFIILSQFVEADQAGEIHVIFIRHVESSWNKAKNDYMNIKKETPKSGATQEQKDKLKAAKDAQNKQATIPDANVSPDGGKQLNTIFEKFGEAVFKHQNPSYKKMIENGKFYFEGIYI